MAKVATVKIEEDKPACLKLGENRVSLCIESNDQIRSTYVFSEVSVLVFTVLHRHLNAGGNWRAMVGVRIGGLCRQIV